MASKLWMVLIVAGCVSGCQLLDSADDARVAFKTGDQAYTPGSMVVAAVTNYSDSIVETGACAGLEMRVEEGWEPKVVGDVTCPAILYQIKPGKSVEVVKLLRTELEPGEYRLIKSIAYNGEELLVASNRFLVQP